MAQYEDDDIWWRVMRSYDRCETRVNVRVGDSALERSGEVLGLIYDRITAIRDPVLNRVGRTLHVAL
jgi:hypothetical protein